MKKIILGFMMLGFVTCFNINGHATETKHNAATDLPTTNSNSTKDVGSDAVEVIIGMIQSENTQSWDQYLSYWHGFMKDTMEVILNDQEQIEKNDGLAVVRSAELVELKELSEDELKFYIPSMIPDEYRKYPLKAYLANINYSVNRVTEYYYNGPNYRIILLALIDGEWKIVSEPEPPVEMLQNYVSVGSEAEQIAANKESLKDLDIALKIRNARIQGYVLDSDMSIWKQNDLCDELELIGYQPKGASACKQR